MFVAEFCSRSVDTISARESVQDAARRMNDRNVGALIVVDDQRHPTGLITDRDITVRVVATGKQALATTVGDVMSQHPVTISEDTTLQEALNVMRAGPFRRVPIVNSKRELSGILALDDVLNATFQMLNGVREIIYGESPASLGKP